MSETSDCVRSLARGNVCLRGRLRPEEQVHWCCHIDTFSFLAERELVIRSLTLAFSSTTGLIDVLRLGFEPASYLFYVGGGCLLLVLVFGVILCRLDISAGKSKCQLASIDVPRTCVRFFRLQNGGKTFRLSKAEASVARRPAIPNSSFRSFALVSFCAESNKLVVEVHEYSLALIYFLLLLVNVACNNDVAQKKREQMKREPNSRTLIYNGQQRSEYYLYFRVLWCTAYLSFFVRFLDVNLNRTKFIGR